MMKLICSAALLMLASCASTPLADLYAGEVSLTQVEQAAYAYTTLPVCGLEKPGQLCRTLATEAVIQKAKKVADDALKSAKTAVTPGSVANFQTALAALIAVVPVTIAAATGGN